MSKLDDDFALIVVIVCVIIGVVSLPFIIHSNFKERPVENMVYQLDDTRFLNSIKIKKRIKTVTVYSKRGAQVTVQNVRKAKDFQTMSVEKFKDRYSPLMTLEEWESQPDKLK